MRPVERGDWPVGDDGLPIQFKDYGDAKAMLIERIGMYCSYCEMPIRNSPAVEHVQPKSKVPELERNWCNFLLACAYCNSIKGDEPIKFGNYFWPDHDNTLRAFSYLEIIVSPASTLDPHHKARALRTIELTGLNRWPYGPCEPSHDDNRWSLRREAWQKAQRARGHLRSQNTPEMRMQIVDTATSTGFWSIWMKVFDDDADMRRRFIEAFAGTSSCCFDATCQALPRPCGAL